MPIAELSYRSTRIGVCAETTAVAKASIQRTATRENIPFPLLVSKARLSFLAVSHLRQGLGR